MPTLYLHLGMGKTGSSFLQSVFAASVNTLAAHGIHAEVYTNQGPKGPALQRIIEEHTPSRAFFIDDLAQHHASVAETVPHVTRLHMCGEPMIAGAIECAHEAGHADARIDRWSEALPWLMDRLEEEKV